MKGTLKVNAMLRIHSIEGNVTMAFKLVEQIVKLTKVAICFQS